MNKILFLTESSDTNFACGVFLIGAQYACLLEKSTIYDVQRRHLNSIQKLEEEITASNPLAVICNFHPAITSWADVTKINKKFPHIPFIKLEHDMTQNIASKYLPEENFGFKYCIFPDTTLEGLDSNIYPINRLRADGSPISPPLKTCPWIGYQGFGFEHKGIHKIAEQVAREFENAILRLHIPYSVYGDPEGHLARKQVERAASILRGTNVIISATHHMMSSIELVQWLSQNDVNCYFYDNNSEYGIASAPDYAISSRRPIAVSNSSQLRYIWKNVPSASIESSTLASIISNGFSPFEHLYAKMSAENILSEIELVLDTIIKKHRNNQC